MSNVLAEGLNDDVIAMDTYYKKLTVNVYDDNVLAMRVNDNNLPAGVNNEVIA